MTKKINRPVDIKMKAHGCDGKVRIRTFHGGWWGWIDVETQTKANPKICRQLDAIFSFIIDKELLESFPPSNKRWLTEAP